MIKFRYEEPSYLVTLEVGSGAMINNLRELRWERDLTVTELAKLCHVSHSTITKIENGDVDRINLLTAYHLAYVLDVNIYEIFPYTKEKE